MSTSLVTQIMAEHLIDGQMEIGSLVDIKVDRIYIQDGNAPTVARLFKEYGFPAVPDPDKIGIFIDHAVLSPCGEMTNRIREAETFAREQGIPLYRGGTGISHVVALEREWFKPMSVVVGADSHTCTGGATNSLALGVGVSDIVRAMLEQRVWVRVPETTMISIVGIPSKYTRAKDVMLFLLSHLGTSRFIYHSIEWCGPWIQGLGIGETATMANLAVELGAKCTFFHHAANSPTFVTSGKILDSEHYLEIDITNLPPQVAKPNRPDNVVSLDEVAGQEINYVFIGSCTNSYLNDLADAAHILRGKSIDNNVICVIAPGSKNIMLQALERGYLQDLIDAGCVIVPPGCGSCVGTQGPIPGDGDNVLSTMNRNFKGRMGNKNASIWLSSPLVAAVTALHGVIPNMDAFAL